jgi:arylsulfatase A-like enzyme
MTMERQSRFKPLRGGNYTVIDGALKLVWDLPHNRSELYDLMADPHERVDLAPEQPSTVERLRALLRTRLDEAERLRTQGLAP